MPEQGAVEGLPEAGRCAEGGLEQRRGARGKPAEPSRCAGGGPEETGRGAGGESAETGRSAEAAVEAIRDAEGEAEEVGRGAALLPLRITFALLENSS